jgi:hypothetical protein
METIEVFVKIECFYFLFLFLGVHLLNLYWGGRMGNGWNGKGRYKQGLKNFMCATSLVILLVILKNDSEIYYYF